MSQFVQHNNKMSTWGRDKGIFSSFDLYRVPSPCFVVDEVSLEKNLRILAHISQATDTHILLALKAFSMYAFAPLISRYLAGVCASGLYEARLGHEEFKGQISTFSPGYTQENITPIAQLSDHVIFNSPAQKALYGLQCRQAGAEVGLRLNPEHSEGILPKYDPCAPCSRLGIPISTLQPDMLTDVSGFHIHTLCEQGFEPLHRTWLSLEPKIAPYLPQLKWINLGGGHHITREDYNREDLIDLLNSIRSRYDIQIYLEPGEAVALNAGVLVGEIIDLPQNEMNLAITNISATCHIPDVIEAPYRPSMLDEVDHGYTYRFGGPSCLAGDTLGDYTFQNPLQIGQRFALLDQAHYSMVKCNTFNGVPLPAIAIWNSETDDLRMVKTFDYIDFKSRLS